VQLFFRQIRKKDRKKIVYFFPKLCYTIGASAGDGLYPGIWEARMRFPQKRKNIAGVFLGEGDSGPDSEESGCLLVVPFMAFPCTF